MLFSQLLVQLSKPSPEQTWELLRGRRKYHQGAVADLEGVHLMHVYPPPLLVGDSVTQNNSCLLQCTLQSTLTLLNPPSEISRSAPMGGLGISVSQRRVFLKETTLSLSAVEPLTE